MLARITVLLALVFLVAPGSTRAQDVARQIQDAMKSDVFNVEMLLRSDAEIRLEDRRPRSLVDVAVARLRVGGQLDGGFRYFGQFDFANSPSLVDLRLGWSPGPEFLIRTGRFKTPFSRELLTFFGARDFNGTARVVSRLAPNRQYGIEMSGRANEHFRWQVGGFTGADDSGGDERSVWVGRVVFDRLGASESGSGLSIGVNAGVGNDQAIAERVHGPSFRGDGTLVGVDARYERDRLMLASEWIRGDYDSERIVPDLLPGARPPIETDASGLYVTAGWNFTDEVQGLVRWDRFEDLESEADDLILVGLNVTPTEYVRLQAVYRAPLEDATEPHRLFANIQLYF